jgi:acyl transferase domain-containing protein
LAGQLRAFQRGEAGAGIFAGRRGQDSPSAPAPTDNDNPLVEAALNFTRGLSVNWKRFYPQGGRCVSLPTYAWQRQRYWLASIVVDGQP